jgi:hypothetical protein
MSPSLVSSERQLRRSKSLDDGLGSSSACERPMQRSISLEDIVLTSAGSSVPATLSLEGTSAHPNAATASFTRSRSPRQNYTDPKTPQGRLLKRDGSAPQPMAPNTPRRRILRRNSMAQSPRTATPHSMRASAPTTEGIRMSLGVEPTENACLQRALRVVVTTENLPHVAISTATSAPPLSRQASEPALPLPRESSQGQQPKMPRKEDLKGAIGLQCCVVCHDAARQVVFMPCKHFVCCVACGREPRGNHGIQKCPICRASIRSRISVYL